MSTKMVSKISIFFQTPHYVAYIIAYISWPVPGGLYLILCIVNSSCSRCVVVMWSLTSHSKLEVIPKNAISEKSKEIEKNAYR